MHQLGNLRHHRTGLRILPSGRPVVKMNASVLIAMALTSIGLKHKAPLPCTAFHCTCFSLTWCSPRIFSWHYCVAVTMRKQVCLRHWHQTLWKWACSLGRESEIYLTLCKTSNFISCHSNRWQLQSRTSAYPRTQCVNWLQDIHWWASLTKGNVFFQHPESCNPAERWSVYLKGLIILFCTLFYAQSITSLKTKIKSCLNYVWTQGVTWFHLSLLWGIFCFSPPVPSFCSL